MLVRRIAGAFVGVWLLAGCPGAEALSPPHRAGAMGPPAQASADIERAEALRVFHQRLERYVALRAQSEAPRAVQGDIFTPRVAAIFRVIVTHAVYDQDIEGMVDSPVGMGDFLVDLVVNEPVPEWAMTKLPAALLAVLPALPDAIEYRLVDGALILWDVHAEILIDWLADPVLVD
jgi:hypothetical protein